MAIIKIRKLRASTWIKDVTGDTLTNYPETRTTFTVGLDPATGEMKKVLNDVRENKDELSEVELFENELNLPTGTLKRGSQYWVDYEIKMIGDELTIDTSKGFSELLKLKVVETSDRIGRTEQEIYSDPKKEYLLYNEEEVAKKSNKRRESRIEAIKIYDKFTIEECREVLLGLGHNVTNMSNELIKDNLGAEVDETPERFLSFVNSPVFKETVLLNSLLNYGILRRQNSQIMYNELPIGYDKSSAILYLKDPENERVVMGMKVQMEEKSGVNLSVNPLANSRYNTSLSNTLGNEMVTKAKRKYTKKAELEK